MGEPIKLCAGGWGFREMEMPAYFAAAAGLGFRWAEMNLTDLPAARHLPVQPTRAQLDAMADAERAAGVKVVCFCGGSDFTQEDPAAVAADVAQVGRYVDMAADYGVEFVRVFAGWTEFADLRADSYARCAAALAEVGAHAADKGVTICLENHGGPAGTAAQVARLLTLADCPAVVSNFDGGNFAMAQEDPLSAYHVLRDRIGYTHWKDVRPAAGKLEYCALGDGITDWAPLVAALLADGYDGYWTMEYEEPADIADGMRKCIDVVTAAAR